MNLGVILGTITTTVHHSAYDKRALMVVGLCRPDGTMTGKETLAVDTVGAGIGDRVLVLKEGNSAVALLGQKNLPLQELIVAVVDHISIKES